MYDLVIKNGTVVTATDSFSADIAVDGEQIAAIGRNLTGTNEIDATGKLVIPGGVDIHVHMQMPLPGGVTSADTFFTGTRAAALGGTTAIVDFVDPKPDQRLLDAFAARRALADPQVAIDYGLHMTLGPSEIEKLDQVADAYAAGCGTFKLYMAYGFRLDDGQLLQALQAIRDAGGLPVVHAENWDVICALVEQNIEAGRKSPHWHPRSRPAMLEGEAVGRVIDIATYVGIPLHIFHVSCEAAMQQIAEARGRGLPVTGETCPQYLFLTDDAYDAPGTLGSLPVCAPPLRPQADQDALWQGLADGRLQLVTTDHCPFVSAEKEAGRQIDFSQIPGGVPSIEMRLSGIYARGVRRGLLSVNQWVDLCCTTPAQLAGFDRKGKIEVGYDADLVVFDPDKNVTLSAETLHENVDWTPYEGVEIQGWPVATISRGVIIARDGQFTGSAGRGKFVSRQPNYKT
jgi:dihydropyrimidinase